MSFDEKHRHNVWWYHLGEITELALDADCHKSTRVGKGGAKAKKKILSHGHGRERADVRRNQYSPSLAVFAIESLDCYIILPPRCVCKGCLCVRKRVNSSPYQAKMMSTGWVYLLIYVEVDFVLVASIVPEELNVIIGLSCACVFPSSITSLSLTTVVNVDLITILIAMKITLTPGRGFFVGNF